MFQRLFKWNFFMKYSKVFKFICIMLDLLWKRTLISLYFKSFWSFMYQKRSLRAALNKQWGRQFDMPVFDQWVLWLINKLLMKEKDVIRFVILQVPIFLTTPEEFDATSFASKFESPEKRATFPPVCIITPFDVTPSSFTRDMDTTTLTRWVFKLEHRFFISTCQ